MARRHACVRSRSPRVFVGLAVEALRHDGVELAARLGDFETPEYGSRPIVGWRRSGQGNWGLADGRLRFEEIERLGKAVALGRPVD